MYESSGQAAAGLDERTPALARTPGGRPPYAHFADRFGAAYDREIGAFLAAARADGDNGCPWRDALEALRLAVAAERSLEGRRRVALAEIC